MSDRLVEARDPASDRLTREDVVAIHKAHIAGEPWDGLAARYGVNRKQIGRIVQGSRWRPLHPLVRPDLYETGGATEPDRRQEIDAELAEIERAITALRKRLFS